MHHIILWELFEKFKSDAIIKLVEKGFHPNQTENGMHLLQKIKGKNWAGDVIESTFHGNHPAYTKYVEAELETIAKKINNNGDQLLSEVQNVLIPKLKKEISKAEKAIQNDPAWAAKTMNDWFIAKFP